MALKYFEGILTVDANLKFYFIARSKTFYLSHCENGDHLENQK